MYNQPPSFGASCMKWSAGTMFPITRHTTVVNGIPTSYKRVGEGEPIVFVHGLSGSTHWWRRNIPELAAQYRLYLVDLPGFGSMWRQRRHFSWKPVGNGWVPGTPP